MTRKEFLMEKTRIVKDLEKRYIEESGIIDSNYLNWLEEVIDGEVVAEWIDIFKVRTATVERGHIFIGSVDVGHISVDYDEDGESYNLVEFEENDPETRSGITISPDAGDVKIDDDDYAKLKYILYGGDSDFSPKRRMDEARKYLTMCGFKKSTV